MPGNQASVLMHSMVVRLQVAGCKPSAAVLTWMQRLARCVKCGLHCDRSSAHLDADESSTSDLSRRARE